MFKLYKAKFFDERGDFLGHKGFKKFDTHFKYQNKRYNIEKQQGSYYEVTTIPLILKTRYYIYNISNSNPIKLDKKSEPIIDVNLYNTIIESEEAKKLNNLNKTGLLAMLDFKTIVIILAVVGVLIYLLQGGRITP